MRGAGSAAAGGALQAKFYKARLDFVGVCQGKLGLLGRESLDLMEFAGSLVQTKG